MRIRANLAEMAEAQRGTLLLWMPLGLGSGIGAYFLLWFEPGPGTYQAVAGIGVGALALLSRSVPLLWHALIALALCAAGFLLAGAEAHRVAAPVLRGHYYGPLEGRVIAIDRSRSNMVRITLDHIWLARRSSVKTPTKVRITLHYPHPVTRPKIGAKVMITASLAAPSGPVEPGGFDFQRYAWFRGLGAIGYSKTPLLTVAPTDRTGFFMRLAQLRMRLAGSIRERLSGQRGAFAAAILTGDRSAIAPEMLRRLRNSNLAHLLAISGLHMGLLSGIVFALVRYGIALVPPVAVRLPSKKVASVAAFLAASAYLLLSGANIATQRAFVMVVVALLAVLLDRRALTLRAVALAAVIVLVIRPVSLIEAGFQMSFAATTALVAVFEAAQDMPRLIGPDLRAARLLRWVLALVASSMIAGLATAPISAFYFNRIAEFGLLANLASVPVMGFVVMPAAVMAILAVPFGLDAPFWAIAGGGLEWILGVAGVVSSMRGAVLTVPAADWTVLSLIMGGGLLVFLLRGRVRFAGLLPLVLGFALWSVQTRPLLLVSDNGSLLGVMEQSGRWLNKAKGSGFVARSWLKKDGDVATQAVAAARPPVMGKGAGHFGIGPATIAYNRGKHGNIRKLCGNIDLLILPRQTIGQPRPCKILDQKDLRRLGAISGQVIGKTLVLRSVAEVRGQRLWVRAPAVGRQYVRIKPTSRP